MNLPAPKSLSILFGAYLTGRMVFVLFPILKVLLFIHPSGALVSVFFGQGMFTGDAWIYGVCDTKLILGELCSGTTFFCLLESYALMRYMEKRIRFRWLFLSYPISLFINASRILSVTYLLSFTRNLFPLRINEEIHTMTGVVIFLITFLILTVYWDRQTVEAPLDR